MKLSFGKGNAKLDALAKKLGKQVFTFSIPSGFTCPYAKDCESRAIEVGGRLKIVDGKHTLFRCFSASQEALFRNVYNSRRHNWDTLLTAGNKPEDMAKMITNSLPKKAGIIRIHVSGDFFTKNYFQAWLMAAAANPGIVFYSYTKSLPFWVWAKELDIIPNNFVLTASYGGHRDDLIEKHNLRYAKVVYSVGEARKLKLAIDHDDSHAVKPGKSFALLIHGLQPVGSEAGKAVRKLDGKGSYRRGAK